MKFMRDQVDPDGKKGHNERKRMKREYLNKYRYSVGKHSSRHSHKRIFQAIADLDDNY